MSDSDDIEHYLAEQTQCPYRAGTPWPMLFAGFRCVDPLDMIGHQSSVRILPLLI
ncbi:MAG: hypothetical protein ABIQ24_11625 [Nitrospiraceae bacterium]